MKRIVKEVPFRGKRLKLRLQHLVCLECGIEADDLNLAAVNQKALSDAYRKAVGLLTGKQIIAGRKKLHWTQEDLANAANVGIASIKRWETGQIQTRAMNDVLRNALSGKASPEMRGRLRRANEYDSRRTCDSPMTALMPWRRQLIAEIRNPPDLELHWGSENTRMAGNTRMKTKEHKLFDVARGKPVVYLETPLLQDGKILNQRHNYERYSVNAGLYPSRLTDGNRKTKAYPASWFFDYIIDLKDTRHVKEIRLVWGMYGKEPDYITEWRLYSQKAFSDEVEPEIEKRWVLVEKGEVPGSEETLIKRDITARRFRIGAASIDHQKGVLLNWIGMISFEAYIERPSG